MSKKPRVATTKRSDAKGLPEDRPVVTADAQEPEAPEPHAAAPDEQQIRERAYLIWVEEGRLHGRDEEHWLRARWELESESQK